MEFIGTNFSITLGSWRMRICFALEDTDMPQAPKAATPHRLRVLREDDYQRRDA